MATKAEVEERDPDELVVQQNYKLSRGQSTLVRMFLEGSPCPGHLLRPYDSRYGEGQVEAYSTEPRKAWLHRAEALHPVPSNSVCWLLNGHTIASNLSGDGQT